MIHLWRKGELEDCTDAKLHRLALPEDSFDDEVDYLVPDRLGTDAELFLQVLPQRSQQPERRFDTFSYKYTLRFKHLRENANSMPISCNDKCDKDNC